MPRRTRIKRTLTVSERGILSLRSGAVVEIRPIAESDEAAEREFLLRLSPQSRRRRFFEQFRIPSPALVHRLTHVDPLREVALVAISHEGSRECIVGVARFAADDAGNGAECAIVVRDDWQSQGLGEALMRELIQRARERGLSRLRSIDDADNADMAALAGRLGFTRRADPSDAAQVMHELQLDEK